MNNNLKKFIFPPKPLSDLEKKDMDILVENIIDSPGERRDFYSLLYNFFLDNKFDYKIIKEYYNTYWVWFVRVVTKEMNYIDPKDFLIFFPRILTTAFALNRDVVGKFLDYMYIRFSTPLERDKLGFDLKGSIVSMDFPVDIFSEEPMSFKNFVVKIERKKNKGEIEDASFLGRLENNMFKHLVTDRDATERTLLVNKFIDFVKFILRTTDFDDIIFDYMRLVEQGVTTPEEYASLKKIEETKKEITNYIEIKKEVENKFGNNFDKVKEIYNYLEQKGVESKDNKIKELIYFDEEMGKFVWNEDLLK